MADDEGEFVVVDVEVRQVDGLVVREFDLERVLALVQLTVFDDIAPALAWAIRGFGPCEVLLWILYHVHRRRQQSLQLDEGSEHKQLAHTGE